MSLSARAGTVLERSVARSRLFVLVGLLGIASLGWFDHLTGPLVNFLPLYAIPVCLVAWFIGTRHALALTGAAIVMGVAADLPAYTEWGVGVLTWNVVARTVL